jgi:hypothetical protein
MTEEIKTENTIEIRSLKTSDFFTMAKILSKIGGRMLRQVTEETNGMKVGLLLLTSALESAELEMMDWLASMANKTVEEFSEMSFDAPLIVIEQMSQKEDMQSFFVRVRGLIEKLSQKQ